MFLFTLLAGAGASAAATFLVWFLIIALFLVACGVILYYVVPARFQAITGAILLVVLIIAAIYVLAGFTGGGFSFR